MSIQKAIIINIQKRLVFPCQQSLIRLITLFFLIFLPSIAISQMESSQTIWPEPGIIIPDTSNVLSTENPALEIMDKVVANSSKNNPNQSTNYSCIVYHKMTFDQKVPEGASTSDSLEREKNQISRDQHLMLMESVSEKQHFIPDITSERIISGRVSGMKNASLAALPSQLQPFSFYSRYINFLDSQYLNPASKLGLKNYLFILRDTIIENNDTTYHINFQPLNDTISKLFEGSIHIDKNTYGIKNISVRSLPSTSDYHLEINLSYNLIDQQQWFPTELTSNLVIRSVEGFNSVPYPLEGKVKSLVTAVNLNPERERQNIPEVTGENNISVDTSGVGLLRYQPLTAKDSASYQLLDSLSKAGKIGKITKFQKELIKGYIPVGPLRLDLKHLVGYNQFEGWKLGLGLWTGEEITGNFTVGGYFKHAFKTKKNNYGTGIKWKPDPESKTAISASYSHDMRATGDFSFHQGNVMTVEDLLKSFSISIMDRQTKVEASIQASLLESLIGKLFFTHADVIPVRTYPFIPEATVPNNAFTNSEYGIKLRWAQEEQLSKTVLGTATKSSPGPKVWLNIISGIQNMKPDLTRYTKFETQIEQSFQTGTYAKTTLRLTSGIIDGQVFPTNLYSFFGTYKPFSFEVPNMFATMGPNEFAADRFAMAFLNHKISLKQNSKGNFKPEINLMTKAGWGDIKHSSVEEINTFNQGFYESGILFDNLLNVLFIKYGIGVHYRYGPLQKEKGIDNWSFRIGLDFSL